MTSLVPVPNPEDLVLGVLPGRRPQPLALTPKDQAFHSVIWGSTGAGKSKLIESLYLQQLQKHRGVGLIEPHHDLSLETLRFLVAKGYFRHEGAFEALIYLDWGAQDRYVPFNILAKTSAAQESHSIALSALDGFLRTWPELAKAPMFQTLFLASAVVLIENNLPITCLYQLLDDSGFRATCLARVADPLVRDAFARYDELSRAGQINAAGALYRRAYLLNFAPRLRYTLGQPENVLDVRQLMDAGQSILIDLGTVPDADTRKLLGSLLLLQFEQAALSRAAIPQEARKPFSLHIDEWPAFAAEGQALATIFEQARKSLVSAN